MLRPLFCASQIWVTRETGGTTVPESTGAEGSPVAVA